MLEQTAAKACERLLGSEVGAAVPRRQRYYSGAPLHCFCAYVSPGFLFGTPAAGRTTFRLCVSQHPSRLQIGDGALASLHPSSLRSLLHHRLQVCMASTARTFMAERAGIGRPAALQTGLACRPSTFGCACQGCESFAHTRCSTAGARVRRMQTCTSSEPMAMTGEQNGNGCSSR